MPRPSRTRLLTIVMCAALAGALLPAVSVGTTLAAEAPSGDLNSLVAIVQPGTSVESIDAAAQAAGLVRIGYIPQIGLLQYSPGHLSLAAGQGKLAGLRGVRALRPTSVHTDATDPYLGSQWGLPATRATTAWSTTTGSGVTVAVVDTGVAFTNSDLVGRIASGGWDFVNNDATAADDNGHGTHVSGIVAATLGNGIFGAGAAPGAMILPVKVLNSSGSGSSTWVAAGITYAADHGARVVNLSLGAASDMPDVDAAISYAVGKGVVVVAAAGNAGNSVPVGYPAANPLSIAVGAVDSGSNLASFSDTGAALDLVAPGISVLSTYPPNTMAYMSGTSMATPFVSAAAALVISVAPGYTPAQVQARLQATAHDLGAAGRDDLYGYGLVDMAAAVSGLGASPTPSPTPTATPTPAPTPTPTPTPAPTATPTPTPTPASTPTPIATPTPTPIATPTPTPIATPTPTPTLRSVSIGVSTWMSTSLSASATASSSQPLAISFVNSAGMTIGQASGVGRVSLSRMVPGGSYRIVYAGTPGTTASVSYQLGLTSRSGYITF